MFLNLFGNKAYAESTFPLKAMLLIPDVTLDHVKTVYSLINESSLKEGAGTNTNLHYACQNPNTEIIEFLLDKDPSAASQARKRNGYLPICYLLNRSTMVTTTCLERLLQLTPDDGIVGSFQKVLSHADPPSPYPTNVCHQVVDQFLKRGIRKLQIKRANFRLGIEAARLLERVLPHLDKLSMIKNSWTEDAWSVLMNSLQKNTSIDELHIRFRTGNGNDLVDLIRHNIKISTLVVGNAKEVDGKAFAKTLAENQSLLQLTCTKGCSFLPIPQEKDGLPLISLTNAVGRHNSNRVIRKLDIPQWPDKLDSFKAGYRARLNGRRQNILLQQGEGGGESANGGATLVSLVTELSRLTESKKYEDICTSLHYDCLLEFTGLWT